MSKKRFYAIARHLFAYALLASCLFPCLIAAQDAASELADAGGPTSSALADAPGVSDASAPETDSDGDLIPDAVDLLPLVANAPVYWSVQKFAMSRPGVAGEDGRTGSGQSWADALSLEIGSVLHAPKAQSSATAMPLTSRDPVVPLKFHPFAPLAVFGNDDLRLGDLQRARAAAFLRGWRAEGADQPVKLTFTVRFLNLDTAIRESGHLEVPVTLGGRKWAVARVVPKNPDDHGISLPADAKVRERDFFAEVDASLAGDFLSLLASSDFSPAFDFARASGLDPEESADAPGRSDVDTLTAIFQSILLNTRRIRVEGPDGLMWTWRVASVDRRSRSAVTFGMWQEGLNAVSKHVYGLPLFVFDGSYPASVAGWDNGFWDFYWTASRNGRDLNPAKIESSRLNADMDLVLSATPPSALPDEGATPVLSHLRGVWFHNHGDDEKAFECFTDAGNAGAPQGFSWCGRCKARMPDIPGGGSGAEPTPVVAPGQNKAEAVRLYKRAADAGYAPGLAWYGRALAHGEGVAVNREAGAAAVKKAADQGYAEGRFLYALFLEKGIGVKANPVEAVELLRQAAWQGSRSAMAALGDLLLKSGSPEGRDWIEVAAEGGDGRAAARLARFLRDGEFGTAPDKAASAKWLQRAADAGDAQSLVDLGEAFRAGAGVRRNQKKAAEYFRRAAEAGNGDGLAWYAICLLEGNGVRRDVPRAIDMLSRAASAGNANAKFMLGACLFGGYGGTEPDKAAAMVHFKSAVADQPAAGVFLGVGYLNGLGVAKNEKKAVECFKSAADHGCNPALLWLAHCYANGVGVEKDLEEARKWARKAADLGIPAGRQMLISIQE